MVPSECVSVFQQFLFRLRTYHGRIAKPAQKYIRWNLLFTLIIFFFLTSAIWIPFIPKVQQFSMEIVVSALLVLHVCW